MSEPTTPSPVPYRVVYSGRVRDALKSLLLTAQGRGLGKQALDAARTIDSRLRIYPQFGEQTRDLTTEGQTVWCAAVPPLFIHYVIDEVNRAVFVVTPIKPLPRTGLE